MPSRTSFGSRKGLVGGVGMIDWGLVKEKVFIPEGFRIRTLRISPALDRYEAKSGFALPRSFREFGLAFGPGTIEPHEWRFAMPGFRKQEEFADPTALTRWLHGCWGGEEMTDEELGETMGIDDPARARRLVLFCRNGSSDFFGWDPLDVTDPDAREYGIYMLGRDDTRVMRLATTFQRFVLTYCFGGTIDVGELESASDLDSEKCELVDYLLPTAEEIDEFHPLGFYPSTR